ncbi:Uncharacterized protein FWK35_00013323 [Aphis craccivora]|uniref:Uncharacterized protein n=1 Tax=Aphis craccivora TaxID=307492 RepID=A0A6G0YEI9_APHCR|nr:Uncharacterized protein FWK35_00013323 [Aphis craccivora]
MHYRVTEKREFSRKTSFRPNRFFYNMVITQKLITVNTLNFQYMFTFLRNLSKTRKFAIQQQAFHNISRRYLKISPLRVENLIQVIHTAPNIQQSGTQLPAFLSFRNLNFLSFRHNS